MDPVQQTIDSYDKIASNFAEDYFAYSKFSPDFKKIIEKFVSFFPQKALILDAGCGPGRDSKFFLENNLNQIGVDMSKAMILEASRRCPSGNFQIMDMRNLEFSNEYFDGIWCCASLLHVPREGVTTAIKEFFRVLKKEGMIFVCVMQGKGDAWVVRQEYHAIPQYFVYYEEREIANLFSKNNFFVNETSITFNKYSDHKWINIFAKKR